MGITGFGLGERSISVTREEAVELAKSGFWKTMSYRDIAMFQMHEKRLCMPFDVFHEAIVKALGRPVYTHEFATNHEGLKKELRGEIPAPSMRQVMELIPEDKRIIVVVDK